MVIIIGLGNPGKKFEKTRHNVGFMAVDEFAKKNNFPEFKLEKKFEALISEHIINEEKIILAKPQTFMNESGKAVREILKNNSSADLIIVHDDIDLPVGKIKMVKDRGSAGHKGVESIIQNIGNDGLARIRIGIAGETKAEAKKVVLKKFSKDEIKILDDVIQKTVDSIDFLIKEGLEKTMNKFN
jgi:peptidyl-tRNA hydrolase, PTH1 family